MIYSSDIKIIFIVKYLFFCLIFIKNKYIKKYLKNNPN